MAGEGEVSLNAGEAAGQYGTSAAGVNGAAGGMPEGSPNLNNPSLSGKLAEGDDKLRGKLGDVEDTLKRGKDGVEGLGDKDKSNKDKFGDKGDRPSGPRPSPPGGGGAPSGGGSPQMSSPQSSMPQSQMPQSQMPQMAPPQPQPMSPPMPSGPTTTLSKDQLAGLMNGAGITKGDLDTARNGGPTKDRGKDGLAPNGVEVKKTHLGVLSKSQMHAVIDKALDNNGVPRDPAVRAKWHRLMLFMAGHESSCNPDAALPLGTPVSKDMNNVGPILSDGHRAQASRGLWQTIPSTFAGNHISGTSRNIYDPVASGSAAVHYILNDPKYRVERNCGPRFDRFEANRHVNGYTGY